MARSTDTLAGINFNVDTRSLETDPSKLNLYSGIVNAGTSIIDKYQKQAEATKLDKFNNALQNFQMDGNVEGLKELVKYGSEQFTNPEARTLARNSAAAAYDTSALTQFNQQLGVLARAGSEEGLAGIEVPKFFKVENQQAAFKGLQDTAQNTVLGNLDLASTQATLNRDPLALESAKNKLMTLQIPAAEKAKRLAEIDKQEQTLGVEVLSNQANKAFMDQQAAENLANIPKIKDVLKANNNFGGVFSINEAGNLVTTPISETEITARTRLQNPNATDLDIKNAVEAEQRNRQLVLANAASAFKKAGVTPETASRDAAAQKLFTEAAASGKYRPEILEQAITRFRALGNVEKSLNTEAQAKLATRVAQIDQAYNDKLALSTEVKDFHKQYGIKPDSDLAKTLSVDNKRLQDALTGVTDEFVFGISQDNRSDLQKEIRSQVDGRTFRNSEGKQVTATPRQIALAIERNTEAQAFGKDKPTINADKIGDYVADVVAGDAEYDNLAAKSGALDAIKKHHQDIAGFRNEATAAKEAAKRELTPPKGNKEIIDSLYKSIAGRSNIAPAVSLPNIKGNAISSSTAPTSPTVPVPRQPTGLGTRDVSGSIPPRDVPKTSRIPVLANRLTEEGLSKEQTAGIIGSLQQESTTNLDPQAFNNTGGGRGAIGISQWRGDRITALEKFAGKPAAETSYNEQVEFLIKELKERGDWDKVKKATTPGEAAIIFEKHFLRAGAGAEHEKRSKNANNIFAALN